MDVHVEFKLASRYQVGELLKRFYFPTPRTPATTTTTEDTTTSKDEDGDHKVSGSGYGTPVEAETEKLIDVELPSEARDQSLVGIARRRKLDVKISLEELDVLVERFRELVPEREFSMAALQGYLLMHKNQPHRAVEYVGKWVQEEMAKREAREPSRNK